MVYSELERIILAYPDKEWDMKWLSMNPNISLKFIDDNQKFEWDFQYLSQHPKLTSEFIKKYNNKEWNKYFLANNQNLSIEYIFENIEFDYHKTLNISCNHTLTIDFIKKNLNYPWAWNALTICMPMHHIRHNPDLPWGLNYHNQNLHITCLDCISEFKNAYKFVPKLDYSNPINADLRKISSIHHVLEIENNPTLTLEIIHSYPNYQWDFSKISKNYFYHNEKSYYSNIIVKWYKKTKLIQKIWRVIEVMTIEQMKPDGKYMQSYIKNLD